MYPCLLELVEPSTPVTTTGASATQGMTALTTVMMTTTEFKKRPTVQSTTNVITTNSVARSNAPTTIATVDNQETGVQSDIPTLIYSSGEILVLLIVTI